MTYSNRLAAGCAKAAIALPLLAAAAPALAQSATDQSRLETVETVEDGERVIIVTADAYVPEGSVTATKSNIPLVETPQSVSVVSRDQIDLLNFVDAQQAVRYVAGATGENYGPDLRFDFIQIRGFTPKQFIDGLATPVTTTIFSSGVDLYAFESLDILKGPASVLYGNSPPGGIYNQTSRRPESDFNGEIALKYGTDDYKQVATTFTGAANEMLDLRVTALYRDREAERDGVEAERFYIAPAATVHIGPATKLTGLAYYQYDETRGDTNGFLPAAGTLLDNPNGEIGRGTNLGEPDYNRYERKQWGLGFELVHEFSDDIGATINAKWSDYDEYQQIIYGSYFADADMRTVGRSSFPYAEDVQSFAIDNRLDAKVYTGDVEHTLLAGLDYRNVRNFAAYGFGFASNIDLYNPVYGVGAPYDTPELVTRYNEQRLRQTGVYAQDQIALGGLRLLLSGRYDWVKSDYIAPFTPVEGDYDRTEQKSKKFTYRAGASYVTEGGFVPYISYATSFEPVLGGDAVTGDAFKPTTGRQIEGGIKYDARGLSEDIDLFATAAIYQIKQKNVVATLSGPALPVYGEQIGAVKVTGGELEFVARIREQLAINGAYSYTDSKITDSNNVDEIGAPLPVTPKHKVSLFADYTFQRGALAGFGFGAGVRYTDGSAGALPSFFEPVVYTSDDATLFDAIVHYDTPNWRFAVNGSNVFDKKYVARCAATFNCNFGAGRQVIGTATYKF